MKKIWEFKQSAQPNTLDLYIYGDVESGYYDWWNDRDVESETSAEFFRKELNANPDVTQINIYINSYGGSVFEGTAIYSQLKRHAANKTVYVDGFACSVASVIAMAGDKVVMPRNAMMMIHNAWTFAIGNAKELRKAADDLDAIMAGNRQAYLEKAGDKLTEEKLIEMLESETWLTAQQCIEYGLADELAGTDADMGQAKQMLAGQQKQQERFSKTLAAKLRELETPDEPAIEPEEQHNIEAPDESAKADADRARALFEYLAMN